MELIKLDSGKIEKAMYDYLVLNAVCPNIRGGSRNMENNDFEEIVYANAPIQINDRDAIGETIMRVEIYAKKIAGYKNAAKLTTVHDKVVSLLPVKLGDYHFEFVNEISGDDRAGFNYVFLNIFVTVMQ